MKVAEEIETECSSFDDLDFTRQPAILCQSAQCQHSDRIVRAHQIAKTKYSNSELGSLRHGLPLQARSCLETAFPETPELVTLASSCSNLRDTNFHPLKMLSIRPFSCSIATRTAL